MKAENKSWYLRGVRDGVPIMLGYAAVGFTLGIAARNAGLTAFQATLASFLNNASAGEYAGFTVFEEDGGADLSSYTNISSMAPLEENGIYFLVEIPDEAAAGPLTMELYLAGQYCHYHVE